MRAIRAAVAADRTAEHGLERVRPQAPQRSRPQNGVTAVTGKHLIAAIALQNDLDRAAQLAGQQIQGNVGRIGKWLVMGLHQRGI